MGVPPAILYECQNMGLTFSEVILFNYDTNRTTTSSSPAGNCWYSELIVSTQLIPAPSGPTSTN